MKSERDFLCIEEYWEYVHTHCVIQCTCVLLNKQRWEDYSQVAKEAVKMADEVIKQLRKKQ